MDWNYLGWAFRRTIVITLLLIVACLVVWIMRELRGGGEILFVWGVTWSLLFAVYVKDPKTMRIYDEETRRADPPDDGADFR